MGKKTTLLDKVRRVTTDHWDVKSWRASLAGVFQAAMLLPFLLLVPYILNLIPTDEERPLGILVGTWTYAAADKVRGSSGVELTLDKRGRFDLKARGFEVMSRPLRLVGTYTVDKERLVLRVGAKRMVWDAKRMGRDLVLTSARGASIRFAPQDRAGDLHALLHATSTASLD